MRPPFQALEVPPTRPARPAASPDELRATADVGRRVDVEGELEASAPDGHAPAILVVGDVHASVVQHVERAFEPVSLHESRDVAERDARVLEQCAVRVLGPREDDGLEQAQEALLPGRHPLA